MHVHDLGTLVVDVAGTSRVVRRSKQGVVLLLLVLHAGRRVSVDELVEAAWDGRPTSSASVENQIWRLRRALQPGVDDAGSVIVYDDGGYRLVVEADEVDSLLFERRATDAQVLLLAGRPADALEQADAALALWRGHPYALLADYPPAAPFVARLEELHTQAHETRVAALLELDLLDQALTALEPLIAELPFREHLWGLRMTALARAGRTVEALATYRAVRDLLVEETGLEPGPELQELHSRVLRHDAGPHGPAATPLTLAPAPALPPRTTRLIGRQADLARLRGLLAEHALVTITGAGGTGKTRLAVELAAGVAEQFPDGVWWVDLTSVREPGLVMDVAVSTLGLTGAAGEELPRALARFVSGRRLLLVLDNCEHLLDGVRACAQAVLGAGGGPVVVATSREPLDLDGELIWSLAPLAVTDPDQQEGLSLPPGLQLFVERAQEASPGLRFERDELADAARICRSVDGLPLGIELAAARVRAFGLAEIVEQVGDDPSRLARPGRTHSDRRHDLYSAVDWSYRLLPAQQQRLHRSLSVLPGAFNLKAAAAVGGDDTYETADALLGLTHRSLLTSTAGAGNRSSSLFAQLETVRAHAQRRLVTEGEHDEVMHRRQAWVAALLRGRPRLGSPAVPAWYDEIEDAYPTIRDSLHRALSPDRDPDLLQHGCALGFFWYFRSRALEGCRWLDRAHAARLLTGRPVADLALQLQVAASLLVRFRPDAARPHLSAAAARLRQVPDNAVVTVAEPLVSVAIGGWSCRAFDAVEVASDELWHLSRRTDDQEVALFADAVACVADLRSGRYAEVGDRAEQLFGRAVEADNLFCTWTLALVRCVSACEARDTAAALAWTQRVAEVQLRLGQGASRAFIEALANCLAANGDLAAAVSLYSAASQQAHRTGASWPAHPQTHTLFEGARRALDPRSFRRAWREGESLTVQDLAEIVVA